MAKLLPPPDISFTRGCRVRVQLVDDKTDRPMKFEKPTKGYINRLNHPQRSSVFLPRSSIVEFSTEGIGEIQVPSGRYTFFTSLPVEGNGNLSSVATLKREEWPIHEAVEGELLEIDARMKIPEKPAKGTLIGSAPPSDERRGRQV